jgi:hypothetical protein
MFREARVEGGLVYGERTQGKELSTVSIVEIGGSTRNLWSSTVSTIVQLQLWDCYKWLENTSCITLELQKMEPFTVVI